MKEDHSSSDEDTLLTSNAEQAQWQHLLVVSCSLPLRAHPSEGCSAHALCVSLLDELKEEVHVVVRHRVKLWRRLAKPGSWCAVAGLLPAPFQHNARVWRTGLNSRVRPSTARGLRAHLYPRAWQEQHSRTRAGMFVVVRRLRSGDLVLRELKDGSEFLLVTYFSSRVASFPLIRVGTQVSLQGALCLERQGVLAMCARTDLRVVNDNVQPAIPGNGNDGCQTFRPLTQGSINGRDEACDINLICTDQCEEESFGSGQLRTAMKLTSGDFPKTNAEMSYLEAVENLFCSPRAEEVLSSSVTAVQSPCLGAVSDSSGTACQSEWRDSAIESIFRERPSKAHRLFDSPCLYKPPRRLDPMPSMNVVKGKAPARGNGDVLSGFALFDLEDEGPGSVGACAMDVGARNLVQYLWYLETVIKFRGRFGEVLGSDRLELAVAKLLGLLSPTKEDQGCDEAFDCPSRSCYGLPDCVLSDCFSDDHACPLVAGGEATFPVQLCLEAAFEEIQRSLLARSEGLDHSESASVSERLQNVVGIIELSPHGRWLFRQPRFNASTLRKQAHRSVRTESTTELFDSGFQSPEDSPSDSGFQSQQNSQAIIDTDSQSQRLPSLFADSFLPSQSSSRSLESTYSRLQSEISERPSSDKQNSESFVAVVMNAGLDASMHGRLVLLSECRLVMERGTIHEMAAGLWVDRHPVQDLAHLRLPAPSLAPPPLGASMGPCPLCAYCPVNVEQCDERWDPDIDSLVSDPGPWESESLDGVDPTFVASSLASRHRFVLHAIAAPALDGDGQRSCLLLISLLQSFAQGTPGRAVVFVLHGVQLRWLPLLCVHAGYTLRGCARRVPDISGLPAFRTQCQRATLERHDCTHDWPAVSLEGTRSLVALVLGVHAPHAGDGSARGFGDSAWLEVHDEADGSVMRLYMSGWGLREPPRAMIRGTRVRVTCVQERISAAGRAYLHPTPLTDIQVVSLVSAEPAWWEVSLPSIGLPGVTAGLLPPRCIRWALAASRCPCCSASKREYICGRCGVAGPGRTRVTLRLRAAQDVELIAVDNVAASVLGYTAPGWHWLIDQVSQEGGALEWAGPDEEVPEDRHSAPWIRRFYAACRSQPSTQLAVRCRAFKDRQDAADVRFVLEARCKS